MARRHTRRLYRPKKVKGHYRLQLTGGHRPNLYRNAPYYAKRRRGRNTQILVDIYGSKAWINVSKSDLV